VEEANDISTFLKALKPKIEAVQSISEITELAQIFPGLMKTILMIWKCSKHYNTPNRLSIILMEICNEIIDAAANHIQPNELFAGEPEESAQRLIMALKTCAAFKTSYFDCKAQTAHSQRPWNFDSKIIFSRLDKFMDRVQEILNLFDTIMEFLRLEKIEIGSSKVCDNLIKGKMLSSQIIQIFNEFNTAMKVFASIKYNILDLKSNEFPLDLKNFHALIADLERRMSTILNQAFDDCSGLHSCFRLLESFGGLLHRENIVKHFEQKYYALLKIYSDDLDDVSAIFLKNKENCPIHRNMAPITGLISWIHELKDRIGKSMEKLRTVFCD
jgi:dynein heavy chain